MYVCMWGILRGTVAGPWRDLGDTRRTLGGLWRDPRGTLGGLWGNPLENPGRTLGEFGVDSGETLEGF